jgi:hypothetical protein
MGWTETEPCDRIQLTIEYFGVTSLLGRWPLFAGEDEGYGDFGAQ